MNNHKTKVKVLVFCGLTAALILANYTNCSPHKSFQTSADSIAKRLSEGAGLFINGDAEFTNNAIVTLNIENNSAKEMYITNTAECKSGGAWEPYAQTKIWTLAQTNAEAHVYAKFRENSLSDVESACASDSIIHDDVAPNLVVLQGAPKFTNGHIIPILLRATDSLSGVKNLICKDAKGSPVPDCREGLVIKNVPQGPGSVQVSAVDLAGNISTPVVQSWLADYTAPKITINAVPSNPSNVKTGEILFSGSDNYSAQIIYLCSIDGGAFAACASPAVYNLNTGAHTFQIKGKDEAGNVSSAQSYTWTIDLSAPTVQISMNMDPFSNKNNTTFNFDGMDDGVALTKFECSVDGGAFILCNSGFTTPNLGEGTHTFQVRGYDSAGNVSAPATYTWTVDTIKPVVSITAQPNALTKDNLAVFQFTATDSGSGVDSSECRIDGGAFQKCNATITYQNLAEGAHSFQVRAIDKAGNISDTRQANWTVDFTAPTIKFVVVPNKMTNNKSAEFMVDAKDNSGKAPIIQCKMDMQSTFSVCKADEIFALTQEGVHNFSVQALDDAGNVSALLTYSWTLDYTGPAINFTAIPLQQLSMLDTTMVGFAVTDAYSAIASIKCGPGAIANTCPETFTAKFGRLPAGSYTYTVTAVDALGNSSTNSVSWSVLDDVQPISQKVVINENTKADILIVIDNSGSMDFEQKNMAARFSTFIDQLKTLDWRIAIVTTDVTNDADKKDGRFLAFSGLTNQYYITSAMNITTAKNAFAATIQRPLSEGSGNEQGIAASYRALQRSKDAATIAASAPNRDFFRSDAVLSIVVVTDSDETNPAGTQSQNVPENLMNYIKSLWATKAFTFNSIVVRSNDSACLAVNGNELYGKSYEKLSFLTGGVVGNVCAADYSTQLKIMGQGVVDLVKNVNLDCRPVDANKNGSVMDDVLVTLSSGTAPSFTIDALKLTFSSALPAGTHQLDYWCLK